MRLLYYLPSLIYRLIISFRNFLFDTRIITSEEYRIPIICVGNITVGGTGKTPQVEYLIRILSNYKVCVLSRGYGRKTKGLIIVDTTSSSYDVGDEPLQIKQKFPQTKVIVCEKRKDGIKHILKDQDVDIIIMDDGFQHRRIKAGLNIIMNNYNEPFYSDKMLPLGKLRDQKISIDRAEIIITSKCPENMNATERQLITNNVSTYPSQKIYFSSIKYKDIISVFSGEKIDMSETSNIILITSIADPTSLINFLQQKNYSLNHVKFRDHYNYTQQDISNILHLFNTSKSSKNIILTTEKDKVKFGKFRSQFRDVTFGFLPIEVNMYNEKEFKTQILTYVREYKRSS